MKNLITIIFVAFLNQSCGQIQLAEVNDGLIYFSFDNGKTWENKSNGLPDSTSLRSIAVSENALGIATSNGIYIFDFQDNSWINISGSAKIIKYNIDALIFRNNTI